MRGARLWAAALLAPLLLLLVFAFLAPVGLALLTAVSDRELSETLPRTRAELAAWDGRDLPPEAAFAVLAAELPAAMEARRLGALTQRLNFERSGMRALLQRTARAGEQLRPPYRQSLVALDPRWGEHESWAVLRNAAGPLTPLYLLRALDLTRTPGGAITAVPAEDALFRTLFLRTLGIALIVTAACVVLAYPVAATIAALRPPWSTLALTLVLVPFWTSVLVRSTAWFVLLQREGPVNAAMVALGLVAEPVQIVGTRIAVLVTMVHVLLPFVILPLLAVLRRMDPALPRAAAALGANAVQRFWRVTLPLSLPGAVAGAAMVFLLAVGYYITPALVGGERDQMVAWFIAQFLNRDVNWGMAAALCTYLLAMTGAVALLVRLLARGSSLTGAHR